MGIILKSLVIIVAVASIAGGATLAVFSDSDTMADNSVSTAKVDIEASGEASSTTLAKPLIAEGLVPGEWSDWARGVIFNKADSTNVRVYMYLTNILGTACGMTNLKITTGHAGSDEGERENIVFEGRINRIDTPGERKEITRFVFDAPDYLPANTSLVIQQKAQLASEADNRYQGADCTWDEVFVAESVLVE